MSYYPKGNNPPKKPQIKDLNLYQKANKNKVKELKETNYGQTPKKNKNVSSKYQKKHNLSEEDDWEDIQVKQEFDELHSQNKDFENVEKTHDFVFDNFEHATIGDLL